MEATTGWRFVAEEPAAIGAVAHLAEPAQTSALRGNKKRAKTDRADARHLRELLIAGRLPESWIPPDTSGLLLEPVDDAGVRRPVAAALRATSPSRPLARERRRSTTRRDCP